MKHISSYHDYLRRRSKLGLLYRRWVVYSRINSGLSGKALDFGCGIGDFLEFRPNTIGVDINQLNVEYCKQRGLDAAIIQNGHIPFPDQVFDGVVMDNVIEHISEKDIAWVLQEVFRVLRVGGMLLIGVPGEKGYVYDNDHRCFYSENDLVNLLGNYNCIKKQTMHLPFCFPGVDKYLRWYCVYIFFEKLK